MRIREVQTERYLMDAFGLFYELPPLVYDGDVFGIKPVAAHMRTMGQHAQWNIFEPLPLLQKVIQHMIANLINILAVRMAHDLQMRRVDNQFSSPR